MKIIFPVLGFGRAGGERVLSKLATGLVKKGHDVSFVVPEGRESIYYPTEARIVTSKVMKKKVKYLSFLVNYFFLFVRCYQLKCDVAVASYHITSFLLVFLQGHVRKKYYIQANEMNFSEKKLPKLIARLSYFLPLEKIVNSESLLPQKINRFSALVPAGVDMNQFSGSWVKGSSELVRVGIVGRKEPYKGTVKIIKAIDEYAKLAEKKLELNVAVHLPNSEPLYIEKINYFEICNDEDLANFYRRNDVVLAVGLIEDGAFHYPCAEAMASGRVVISNYAPLVTTNSDFKIEYFSQDLVIEKLNLFNLKTNDQIMIEIENNKKIISDFSWDIIVDKFEMALKQ